MTMKCRHCSKEFRQPKSRVVNGRAKFCSRHCKTEAQKKWTTNYTTSISPIRQIQSKDVYWAAGFLEGEGCFLGPNRSRRSHSVSAGQVNRQPLRDLQDVVGGRIRLARKAKPRSNIFQWVVYGARARGLMMMVYPFMSNVRKDQIRIALSPSPRCWVGVSK